MQSVESLIRLAFLATGSRLKAGMTAGLGQRSGFFHTVSPGLTRDPAENRAQHVQTICPYQNIDPRFRVRVMSKGSPFAVGERKRPGQQGLAGPAKPGRKQARPLK